MRGRPRISYELSNGALLPGEKVDVTLVFESGGATRFDAIHVRISGYERRTLDVQREVEGPGHETRETLDVSASIDAGVLSKGIEHRTVSFDLPHDLPPSYVSEWIEIVYTLHVHVVIPWWADARETFTIVARPAPATRNAGLPVRFASRASPGSEPFIELALEAATMCVGGVVRGAIALRNFEAQRVAALELVLESTEAPRVASTRLPVVTERWPWLLREHKPADGEVVAFEQTLPDHVTPEFESNFVSLRHHLVVRAVDPLGADVTLRARVRYLPQGALDARDPVELPDVGWAVDLRAAGARLEARKRLRSTVRGSALVVALEGREMRLSIEADGVATKLVADLAWPRLGIDLRITDRGALALGSPPPGLPTRFTFRAREEASLQAVFDAPTRAAIDMFDSIDASDAAGRFTTRGSRAPSDLDAFIDRAVDLDARLAGAAERVPTPAALADAAPKLRALAEAWGARLTPGDLSIEAFDARGVDVVVRHRFDGARAIERRVEGTPIAGTTLPADFGERLARELGARVDVGDRVVVHVDLARDVGDLDAIVATLSGALRRLAHDGHVGPYR